MNLQADPKRSSLHLPSVRQRPRLIINPQIGKLTSDVFTSKARPSIELLKSHQTSRFSQQKMHRDDASIAKRYPPLPQLRNASLNTKCERDQSKPVEVLSPRKARAKLFAERINLPKLSLPALTVELQHAQRVIDKIINLRLAFLSEDKSSSKAPAQKSSGMETTEVAAESTDYASYWNGVMISQISIIASDSEDPEEFNGFL